MLILIEMYGLHFLWDLIQSGRAYHVKNVEQIIDLIQSKAEIKLQSTTVTYYWERNSKEKIYQRIKEIIETVH